MAVYMEIIVLRFLLISSLGMVIIAICIALIFYLKLSGLILLTGWATSMVLGLSIIFIIFLLICFFSLLALLNKNLNPNLLSGSAYKHFILSEEKLN